MRVLGMMIIGGEVHTLAGAFFRSCLHNGEHTFPCVLFLFFGIMHTGAGYQQVLGHKKIATLTLQDKPAPRIH